MWIRTTNGIIFIQTYICHSFICFLCKTSVHPSELTLQWLLWSFYSHLTILRMKRKWISTSLLYTTRTYILVHLKSVWIQYYLDKYTSICWKAVVERAGVWKCKNSNLLSISTIYAIFKQNLIFRTYMSPPLDRTFIRCAFGE